MDDDEAYHQYLWGEESPREFARRHLVGARPLRVDLTDRDVARDVAR